MAFPARAAVGLLLGIGSAAAPAAEAAAPETLVRIVPDPLRPGARIPSAFSGLSFESAMLLRAPGGSRYFSASNRPLVALFRTLGIRTLRIGGNTADEAEVPIAERADIDALFGFADAADLEVIYTLRLRDGDPGVDAGIARYIAQRYRRRLAALAIGNEPNFYFPTYAAYHRRWRAFRDAVEAVAPLAPLTGPSVGPARWLQAFANEEGPIRGVGVLAAHVYFGGAAGRIRARPQPGGLTPAQARDLLLSPELLLEYDRYYRGFVPAASAAGLPYALEETNNFYNGGAADVSDTFASALWALDYLHWWAERGAQGLNFHTGDQVAAGAESTICRYAAFVSTPNGYAVRPLGYALKAFDLAGTGRPVPLALEKPAGLNLTAYAIVAEDGSLRITVINKEHGPARKAVLATIPAGLYGHGAAMLLKPEAGGLAARTGITLGASGIGPDGAWTGRWTALPKTAGTFTVQVPAGSAAVVRLAR